MRTWTEISAERLAGNFLSLRGLVREGAGESVELLAVVKANAYGHGLNACAELLAAAGAEWLGVTDALEGSLVRQLLERAVPGRPTLTSHTRDFAHPGPEQQPDAGSRQTYTKVKPRILVMSGTTGLEGEAERVVRHGLTAVVWEPGHVTRISEAARSLGVQAPVRVHLEVDTGMSRQGVAPGAALDATLRALAGDTRIALDGVFTHFASTEVTASSQTAAQQASFEAAMEQLRSYGLRPPWVHAGNSSYIDNTLIAAGEGGRIGPLRWLAAVAAKAGGRPMVRSGLGLYGYLLPIEGAGRSLAAGRVLPVMTWKTRVIGIRGIAAGAAVGYGGGFVARRPMRLALLPVGYADGMRRELSSTNERAGGWVMIRGERAEIVGRVSMNLTTVDVSSIPGAVDGDEAVLLGEHTTADDHARLAGTIAYEILCGVRAAEAVIER